MNIPARFYTLFAGLAVASVSLVGPEAAEAQPGPIPVTFCGPAPLFVAMASNIVRPDASVQDLRDLSATSVDVAETNGVYRLSVRGTRTTASVPVRTAAAPDASSGSCKFHSANGSRLVGAKSVPGIYIAALAAVGRFNEHHPYPLGSVDRNVPANSVIVGTLGPFALVTILGNMTPGTLGCPDQEWYRVDVSTFEVLPYQEGCLEGGGGKRVLPRLRDLPGRQPG